MRTLCYMCGAHCVTCAVCEGHMCAHCVTCAVHIVLHVLHMRIVRVTRIKCAHIVLHVQCTLCYMCGAHCVTCTVICYACEFMRHMCYIIMNALV